MYVRTALLLSLFTALLAVNGAARDKNELTVRKSRLDHSDKTVRVLKRQLSCSDSEYHTNVHCCKLCPAGTYKSKDCLQEHGLPECTPCQEGLYMNIANNEEECHRCTVCDPGEGFEVEENCTSEQNTICQCMEHYFCSATSPCKHCEPCDKCENRKIKEDCTRRKNTVCQDDNQLAAYAIVLIVLGFLLTVAAAAAYFWYRKRHTSAPDQPIPQVNNAGRGSSAATHETIHLLEGMEDVDLEPHFTDIALKTTIEQMLILVRRNGMSEPIIEQIKEDNRQNANEQKIQLLRHWYQSHGQRGAFAKLIKTFEENGCRAVAEKIFEMINSSASSRMTSNSVDPEDEHDI